MACFASSAANALVRHSILTACMSHKMLFEGLLQGDGTDFLVTWRPAVQSISYKLKRTATVI